MIKKILKEYRSEVTLMQNFFSDKPTIKAKADIAKLLPSVEEIDKIVKDNWIAAMATAIHQEYKNRLGV